MEGITCSLYHTLQCRKAEFLLADALDNDCDCIVTFGGVHSNHARVMSLAARELGLDCVLFIQTHPHSEQVKPLPQYHQLTTSINIPFTSHMSTYLLHVPHHYPTITPL